MTRSGRYGVYGHEFIFETNRSAAFELIDGLYAPYSTPSPKPAAVRYALLANDSGRPGARSWLLQAPNGPDWSAGTLAQALQEIEAVICGQIIRQPKGFHPVHAALLQSPGGGLVISGRSGAGKTTLALALQSRGLPLAADDAILLSAENNLLHAVPRCFHLDQQSIRLLEADGMMITRFSAGHGFVTPRDLSGSPPPPQKAGFVFFLQPERRSAPSLVPMTQAQMATTLLNETARGGAPPLKGVTAIAEMVSSCQCFALHSGPLAETADAVAELVRGGNIA